MKRVFVDTSYFVAIASPKDSLNESAKKARESLGKEVILITTDEVLVEFLNYFSKCGVYMRNFAVETVNGIRKNPNIVIRPQTRNSFMAGLELYSKRPDKHYSLTDCISMAIMKSESISDILTSDPHFAQEGFNALIPNR